MDETTPPEHPRDRFGPSPLTPAMEADLRDVTAADRQSLHLRVEPALAEALARFAHATHRSKNGAASYLLWRALADEQPRRGTTFQPEPTETR